MREVLQYVDSCFDLSKDRISRNKFCRYGETALHQNAGSKKKLGSALSVRDPTASACLKDFRRQGSSASLETPRVSCGVGCLWLGQVVRDQAIIE